MESKINFNLNPYYDDFQESKEFYRILFKPGYAVQARELTQLQTQLQNQITKFGKHIFKEGSVVLNGDTFFYGVSYIIVSRNGTNTYEEYVNKNIIGQTSEASGTIVKTEILNNDFAKIYFKYINGNNFQKNETVVFNNVISATIQNEDTFYGTATAFSINEGIFFVGGHFVFCNSQTIIISENFSATCRVGLQSTESIVTPSQDTSLLDPALGSYNYSAPGADRYAISLDLISFDYNPAVDTVQENASDNFVELARFVNGIQTSVNKLPIYSEIENTLARRTYDESGDYTVKAFGLKVREHVYGNTESMSLQIEPGKAYVKGYEFETISPYYLDLPRSKTTVEEDQFPIYVNYGNFLYIKQIKGDLDYTGNKVIELHDNVDLINVAIGNAIVKYIQYDSLNSGNSIYKIYLDNVNIFDPAGNSTSDIRAIKFNSDFRANVETSYYTTSNVTSVSIQGSENLTSILQIPKNYVRTLLLNGGDTTYTTLKKLSNSDFVSNGTLANTQIVNPTSEQIFLGSGTLSASDTRELFLVTVLTSSNTTVMPVGTVLDYTTHGLRVNIVDENTVSISCNCSVNFVGTVYSKLAVTNAIQKNKTLTTGTLSISGASLTVANLTSKISLQKADCTRLISVIATSNTAQDYDFTKNYSLDTGQTDTLYDHGFIQLKPGKYDPISSNAQVNIASVVVTFDYYAHSGTAGFFSVDSYPNYDDIPSYTSSTGTVYNLRDCVDFRPKRADGSSTIQGTLLAEPTSTFFCDFDYYIGRIDKLILTKERKFTLVKGIPADRPSTPVDLSDGMTLYTITLPPYTGNPKDVTFKFIENKRYTMRDIGKIEKRVERLEFYTTLSYLEKQSKDESIPSNIPTIDRFKNGILVDSFSGHSVGDVNQPDYSCSIDYINRYLRPKFSSDSYNFNFNSGTNHKKSGDLITLNYTTETFLNQPLFSRTVNLNPYFIFNWNGVLTLNPPSDTWVDTQARPDVVVNLNGENDVYTTLVDNVGNPTSTSGVRWTDWQTISRGIPETTKSTNIQDIQSVEEINGRLIQTTVVTNTTESTTTVTDQIARVGLNIQTGAVQTITRDLGTKVVDTSIVPFIRSRLVDFSAKLLKPVTELIATFDGEEVTSYCFPATEIVLSDSNTVIQNAESITLSTDSNITGRVIYTKRDRVFVRENNGSLFRVGNTINWIVNGSSAGSSVISRIERPIRLITNEKGDVAGTFAIPPNKFRTGERLFKLSDYLGIGGTTAAATKYIAQGLSQSTERTLVSTRVASVAVNPVLDTKPQTTTSTTVTNSTNTTVRDITPVIQPEPVLPEPQPVTIQCQRTELGGSVGTHTYTLEFGSNTGFCGISYDTDANIPDRFTITWNGQDYTSGFVGSNRFDTDLRQLGFPTTVGPRIGNLLFNKTQTFPTTAILRIDAPFDETLWRFRVICPEDNVTPPEEIVPPANTTPSVPDIIPPAPIPSGSMELTVTPPASYTFFVEDGPLVRIPFRIETLVKNNPARYFKCTALSAKRKDTNLELSIVRDNGNPWTLDRSNMTLSRINDTTLRDRQTPNINFFAPDVIGSSYTVEITFSGELFEDEGLTVSAGLVDSAIGEFVVNSTDASRYIDPVAQTFFVDPNRFPSGLFLDSIDLYFKSKSDSAPVTVEIRPTVNGYPSSRDIVPFSIVTKEPEDINISSDASLATNFKFEAPVYLPPGEHSFIARCDSTEYEIYSAFLGEFLLTDPNLRITEQPAVGSLFKSQNLSTWTATQEEDLMFRLNKCVFNTGVANAASVVLHSNFPAQGNVLYDLLFADGENLDFADTNIDYYYKTTSEAGVTDASFTQYQLGSNVPMVSRRILRSGTGSDLQFNMILSTDNRNLTPVIDLTRFSSVVVQNIIDNASLKSSSFVITNYGEGYTSNSNVSVNITADSGSGAEAVAIYNSNTKKIEIVVTNGGSGYTGNISATITKDDTATANVEVLVKNEIDGYAGNADSRYMTRKVTLAPGFESSDLKLYLLANIPSKTSIKVYYKVTPENSTIFDEEIWREMQLESSGDFTETGYADYKYKTPGDAALPSGEKFRTFTIKIVMLSSDPVRVPIIRDLRVIALDE